MDGNVINLILHLSSSSVFNEKRHLGSISVSAKHRFA
jgi:hypothetical protein